MRLASPDFVRLMAERLAGQLALEARSQLSVVAEGGCTDFNGSRLTEFIPLQSLAFFFLGYVSGDRTMGAHTKSAHLLALSLGDDHDETTLGPYLADILAIQSTDPAGFVFELADGYIHGEKIGTCQPSGGRVSLQVMKKDPDLKSMRWLTWWWDNEEKPGSGSVVVEIEHQSADYRGAPYALLDSISIPFRRPPADINNHPRVAAARQRLLRRLAHNYKNLLKTLADQK